MLASTVSQYDIQRCILITFSTVPNLMTVCLGPCCCSTLLQPVSYTDFQLDNWESETNPKAYLAYMLYAFIASYVQNMTKRIFPNQKPIPPIMFNYF